MDMQFNHPKVLNELYKHETVCIETSSGSYTGLIEWRDDCEKGRIFYDNNQNPIDENTILNWSFGECDCETLHYYEYDSTTINGQLRNREWHNTAPVVPIASSNTATGRNFRLTHNFSLPTTIDNFVTTLALNDTDNTAVELDIQVLEGFIIVPKLTYCRYGNDSSEGYTAVEIGFCCGKLELVSEGGGSRSVSTAERPPFWLPAGIHNVRIWNIDSGGTNSSDNFQISNDNGQTWVTNNSAFTLSTIKPEISCKVGSICNGVKYTESGSLLILSNLVSLCKPDCNSQYGQYGAGLKTTLATQVLTSITTPTFPVGTKEVVEFNDSNALIQINTNIGSQTVLKNGVITFAVDDLEPSITATSISVVSGTFSAAAKLVFNYRMMF